MLRLSTFACAVASASSAVAAELEATWFGADEVSADEVDDLERAPDAVARAARRARATALFQVPVLVREDVVGTVELLRAGIPFDATERQTARVVAAHVALAVRAVKLEQQRALIMLLIATMLLGTMFLGIKFLEYHHEWEEGVIPGHRFAPRD